MFSLFCDGTDTQDISDLNDMNTNGYMFVMTFWRVVLTQCHKSLLNAKWWSVFFSEMKGCDVLTDPNHGKVMFDSPHLVLGTQAAYQCDASHELVGPQFRKCGLGGRWNHFQPSCGKTIALLQSSLEETFFIPFWIFVRCSPVTLIYFNTTNTTCFCCLHVVLFWSEASFQTLANQFVDNILVTDFSVAKNKKCPESPFSMQAFEDRCYEFIPVVHNWMDASEDCKKTNATFLTLNNFREVQFVAWQLERMDAYGYIWAALSNNFVNTGWSLGQSQLLIPSCQDASWHRRNHVLFEGKKTASESLLFHPCFFSFQQQALQQRAKAHQATVTSFSRATVKSGSRGRVRVHSWTSISASMVSIRQIKLDSWFRIYKRLWCELSAKLCFSGSALAQSFVSPEDEASKPETVENSSFNRGKRSVLPQKTMSLPSGIFTNRELPWDWCGSIWWHL